MPSNIDGDANCADAGGVPVTRGRESANSVVFRAVALGVSGTLLVPLEADSGGSFRDADAPADAASRREAAVSLKGEAAPLPLVNIQRRPLASATST